MYIFFSPSGKSYVFTIHSKFPINFFAIKIQSVPQISLILLKLIAFKLALEQILYANCVNREYDKEHHYQC